MRVFGIVLVLLVFVLAGCGGGSGGSGSSAGPASSGQSAPGETTEDQATELRTVTIAASGGEEVEVRVEIADDDAERQRGLMGRTSLGEDRGMLFVFDEEQVLSFWMKNTLIPLSIAYVDSEGRIVDIQDMKPVREQTISDLELPRYVSAEPAKYALEVNQGFFRERGVEVGDRAELPE